MGNEGRGPPGLISGDYCVGTTIGIHSSVLYSRPVGVGLMADMDQLSFCMRYTLAQVLPRNLFSRTIARRHHVSFRLAHDPSIVTTKDTCKYHYYYWVGA